MSLCRDWVAASWDLAVEFSADERAANDIRGYQTRADLEFHTDVFHIVGLLCLRIATQV
jgi:hypothetical protein